MGPTSGQGEANFGHKQLPRIAYIIVPYKWSEHQQKPNWSRVTLHEKSKSQPLNKRRYLYFKVYYILQMCMDGVFFIIRVGGELRLNMLINPWVEKF